MASLIWVILFSLRYFYCIIYFCRFNYCHEQDSINKSKREVACEYPFIDFTVTVKCKVKFYRDRVFKKYFLTVSVNRGCPGLFKVDFQSPVFCMVPLITGLFRGHKIDPRWLSKSTFWRTFFPVWVQCEWWTKKSTPKKHFKFQSQKIDWTPSPLQKKALQLILF